MPRSGHFYNLDTTKNCIYNMFALKLYRFCLFKSEGWRNCYEIKFDPVDRIIRTNKQVGNKLIVLDYVWRVVCGVATYQEASNTTS